ncbi:maleylpyruvate isomerase N-terminal domain-containing protein [Actinomadura madurae]|uniref:maleylpyruvate isomerase N-terminal domain-containing protein n=1 Tax=Actinomadura madurae TaxID=1993 RepID=UPI0020D20F28|nr:maleylpyruvate isomerase N-terminal domain-containing protein [Actinomadura madurae]MCP9964724.1 maleylpyruvate isomerase N-terminal domain-containing protein [Actinomadura madurae]
MALPDDPAERHRQVAGLFTDRVLGTRSWDAPSPVADWTARDVVRHLTDWFPGFLASGAGIDLPGDRPWTRTRWRRGGFTATACKRCWTIRRRRTGSSPTPTSAAFR